ncbi:GNAT family N-acetyltransferase [bacterium]|nr:GNAT family N-acetyltransferase [bacterium]
MIIQSQTTVRAVNNGDRTQLSNMVHFGTYVHRHLDWRPPLEWIGHKPFFTIESEGRLIAALASPPDPPSIAWLRLFVCSSHYPQNNAWEQLWPPTVEILRTQKVKIAAAIPLQKWFRELLIGNGFEHIHNIISLAWDPDHLSSTPPAKNVPIRDMTEADFEEISRIDSAAFGPLWQNSIELLALAYNQANVATVAYDEKGLTGYQISTPTQYGAHLGRLATHPRAQGKGIGYALVKNLQKRFHPSNAFRLSVNTQDINKISLALYQKAGFIETSEIFPIYQYNI